MTNEPTPRSDSAGEGENLAAKRYAMAAFELAQEHNDADAWLDAMRQIAEFMGDPEVKRVLENTRVSQEPKQRLIDAALNDLPALPLNLARLLVRKNRTALAVDIAGQFEQLLEDATRRVPGTGDDGGAARATPSVPACRSGWQQQTAAKSILETEVDPELLGGVVVQIGDRLIDASTRSKLRALRDSLARAF